MIDHWEMKPLTAIAWTIFAVIAVDWSLPSSLAWLRRTGVAALRAALPHAELPDAKKPERPIEQPSQSELPPTP
jgi:hypothetical protein